MKNFKKMFVVRNGEYGGWSNSTTTGFVISVQDDELSIKKKFGRDMYASEINTALGRFLLEYEKEFNEKVALYERRNWYRFCYRQGGSGCQDTFIEFDREEDGFPVRKFMMHQSCFGKTGALKCYAYDFLDLCVTARFLAVEDGFYSYLEEEDANSSIEMEIVKPRLLDYEEGWTSPLERPLQVVYLTTCRETPAAE